MAARNVFSKVSRNSLFSLCSKRCVSSYKTSRSFNIIPVTCLCVGGATLVYYASKKFGRVHAVKQKKKGEDVKEVKLTARERRFVKFASVEYNGQLYMTPQDFLESVVDQEPRPRLKRRALTNKDLQVVRDVTPPLKRGSSKLFRSLQEKGMVSYTEYLFLLTILTKPSTGFEIAFNMFDTDGNKRVDKNEFLVIRYLMGRNLLQDRELDPETQAALMKLIAKSYIKKPEVREVEKKQTSTSFMEKIFSHAWRGKHGLPETEITGTEHENYVNDEQGLQRKQVVDTTLIIHFFGKKGRDGLKYEDFKRFMENLQTEILELEFSEFSKGQETITEEDFARILLRYTYLDANQYEKYLERLVQRVKQDRLHHRFDNEIGITFKEFQDFCQFLNSLDDFTIAMRMYTLADRSISKDEFQRAAKICTGNSLSDHLVHIVFQIFDEDGDGHLSYREFIAIMRDRVHRGFRSSTKHEGWEAFKSCVRQEMRSQL